MPRKKETPEAEDSPPRTIRVRIEPYFAVSVLDDRNHAHERFLGATALQALSQAKYHLAKGKNVKLLVTNGKLVHAIGWSAPTYPDDSDLLEDVLRITGGTLLD
jgi:hypothetical protein